MTAPTEDGDLLLHATTVALDGRGVLIGGPSGSGKSDLALRLIDGGAILVSDDQTLVRRRGAALLARAPATIAGLIEVRGIGIVTMPHLDEASIALHVELVDPLVIERLPPPDIRVILGVPVPVLRLAPFQASAAAKLRLAAMRLARQ